MENDVVLSVNDMHIAFLREKQWHEVVRGVSFDLRRGRTLGLVGESGSGKSVSALALMGLLPAGKSQVPQGSASFCLPEGDPVDLLQLGEREFLTIRGNRISMIFQEPMTSLNPVMRCGEQVAELLRTHTPLKGEALHRRVVELFEEVLLPRPEKIYDAYPHQISGGQKQRVMIAMALACNPQVLIADEPTTALDVTVQKTILTLLRQLQQKYGMAILFITHDLGVVSKVADDVAVLYHGEIVEQGPASEVLYHPQHPYTQGLLACRPPAEGRPVHLPTVSDFLAGECPQSSDAPQRQAVEHSEVLMYVEDLAVTFPQKKNIFGKVTQELVAVDHLSFDIYKGETLGLVGESGSGKTTLGRALLQLIDRQSGQVTFAGQRLDTLSSHAMRRLRPRMQIIFQDPYSSLNPRMTIGQHIEEPLRCHCPQLSATERRGQVEAMLTQVGLEPAHYNRYPHEFSGGQRQRACIARALIMRPELVVCDESVAALDVSVQAQVLNLLNDLKSRFHYTYLFITHDLSVVRFMSDRLMVLQNGKVVEMGPADEVYQHPQHPYTQNLIDAIPRL